MLSDPGLYVHFPWCVKKCPYCDFNSHPLTDAHDFNRYTTALLDDLQNQAHSHAFATVFFGGGTPSLFAPNHFATLLKAIPTLDNAEVTMEANPGTTEHADFAEYREAGINRLSVGAQSFDNAMLVKLGRIHAREEIFNTYHQARDAGFDNINLDLMYALPGQTVEDCLADLDTAITLAPDHLSWYQLTLEPKTEFARRPPVLPQEDATQQMEEQGLALLARHGYTRYEVSAFHRAGAECKHNLNYWQFGDYAGIGAGAHGKISERHDGRQTWSIRRTQKPHQPRVFQAYPTQTSTHAVASDDLIFEFMLNALRLVNGVSFDEFTRTTGLPASVLSNTWSRLIDLDLVESHRIATTALGFRYLDTVVSEFAPQR